MNSIAPATFGTKRQALLPGRERGSPGDCTAHVSTDNLGFEILLPRPRIQIPDPKGAERASPATTSRSGACEPPVVAQACPHLVDLALSGRRQVCHCGPLGDPAPEVLRCPRHLHARVSRVSAGMRYTHITAIGAPLSSRTRPGPIRWRVTFYV